MNTFKDSPVLTGAVVIDVRTPAEFNEGHLPQSVNIPLNELTNHIEELKKMANIVVCCASGIRSKKAAGILLQNGISSHDGGSWLNLQNQIQNN